MAMKRRDFIKAAAACGLGLVSPFGPRLGWSQTLGAAPYEGLFFVMLNAGGGWDPTSVCDPKGALSEDDTDPMNRSYLRAAIEQAGNIPYAPVANFAEFFAKHHQRLLVINGVDTATNGHDSGSRHIWSGRLAEGYPALPALLAGSLAADKPLAFISNGGYDSTQGLVAPTRASGGGSVFEDIAFPNRHPGGNEDDRIHTQETWDRIHNAQNKRLEMLLAREHLLERQRSMGQLHIARANQGELRRLTENLPPIENSDSSLVRQAKMAIAAYKSGITASANLSMGGFDTHGNHDASHIPRLQTLLEGYDFLIEEAERQGVLDKMVVMISSDFGRTPGYNGQNGKDHWSITSVMLSGPGIAGNRVVGSTTDRHSPIPIDPQTLAPSDEGTRIKPSHIHRALRKLAGVDEVPLARQFPLEDEDIPILG